jgi:hypothetical protein
MLDISLNYAKRRWHVFPLKPQSKYPATTNGFYDATTNPERLRRWFAHYPYNIAVRTGLISGIFILDADGNLGAASLHDLASRYGALPATLISLTGKGKHYWFKADVPIPCSVSKIAANVDIRADAGYVVAPPSVHPSGATYRWANDLPPAQAPEWLVRWAQRQKPPPICCFLRGNSISENTSGRYGRAALEREISALCNASKGSRNAALNRTSFKLFQLVAGGELGADEVKQKLLHAARANGLMTDPDDGPRRVIATIRSGARAGLRFPRRSQQQ